MKIIVKNLTLIFTLLFLTEVDAQNFVNLGNKKVVVTNDVLFYDDGGSTNPIGSTPFQSTIKAQSGTIKMFFAYIDIPSDATLKIYKGLDTTELIGLFDGQHKPENLYGEAFTIVYAPGVSSGIYRGWEGIIQPDLTDNTLKATKPESDCVGAIPLCNNSTVNTSVNQYEDTGLINDDSGSCYSGTGNGGSVWYSFTPQASGNIDFMISPTGSTDYDFVLWDITGGCATKTQMSCNFSGTFGATGLDNSGATDSEGSSGPKTNILEAVLATGTYAICINYYSGNNDGFTLNFQQVAGTVAVTDNTPPTITNAYTTNCASASVFNVAFSEYINCSTLDASDFSIPGYTVALTTTNCNGGKTNGVVITVSPAMAPGSYNLTATSMNDMCGNPLNSVFNINTTAVPTANAGPDKSNCRTGTGGLFSPYVYSSVTLTGSGGSNYIWSNGQSGASISVNPSAATTYTLTSIQGSCAAIDQVIVTPEVSPTPNLGADQTICQGASINLTATGGGTYQWQSTTTTGFFGPTGFANIGGATGASYSTSPPGTTTIYYQAVVSSPSGFCTGSDYKKITIDPILSNAGVDQLTCAAGSTINLSGTHTNGSTFSWNVGSPAGTQLSTIVTATATPATSTTYYFTATSATGCVFSDAMIVSLANYGNINNVSAASCDIANITMSTPPSMIGATSYTFNWYEQAGVASPCPTTPAAMTLISTQTIATFVSQSLYAQNFDALPVSTTLGASPGGWSQQTVTASVNNWGIGATALAGMTGNHLQIYNSATINTYLGTDDANKIAKFGPIANPNGEGLVLTFNWKCKGEAIAGFFGCGAPSASAGDYLQAVISTDGVTWTTIGGPYYNQTTTQLATINIPTAYNYINFYIGFRWINDDGTSDCTNTLPAMVDNINIQANVNQYPTTSYNPPVTVDNKTYVLEVVPTGGTCNAVPSLMATCVVANCVVLPIKLTSFTGECENNFKKIEWITATEINNDFFTLEQSKDGIEYVAAKQVKGAGNSNEQKYYQAELYSSNDYNYFRLKQTDFDGQFSYSEPLYLKCTVNITTASIFPNPVTNEISIQYDYLKNKKVLGYILNVLGERVKYFTNNTDGDLINISITDLPSGMYSVLLISEKNGEFLTTTKFIKK